jgi:hypothetical protein
MIEKVDAVWWLGLLTNELNRYRKII